MIIQRTNEVNLSSSRLIQEWIRNVGYKERALHDALRFSVVPTSRNKHMLLKIKVGNVKIVLSMR